MREEELYFSYRQQLLRKEYGKRGEVDTSLGEMYRVRCSYGSCPVMIDISAQRFMCRYHMRKSGKLPPTGHSAGNSSP